MSRPPKRWLDWLEEHGALERNAAVAVLAGLVAAIWGRPAEAERLAEAADRATYEGTLSDGSDSIVAWLALLRALRCRHGVATMRADAELAIRTLARGSPFRPIAVLLLALSQWLAGEVDQADDLLADVAEEGLRLGGPEPAGGGARRARRDRDRTRRVGPGRGASQAERFGSSADRGWTNTPPAHSSMRWRPASHSTVRTPRTRTRSLPGRRPAAAPHLRAARTSRSRPALELARAYLATRRRGRSQDHAARDRGGCCAANRIWASSLPRWRNCARA